MIKYYLTLIVVILFACTCSVDNEVVETLGVNQVEEDSIIIVGIDLIGDVNVEEMPLTRGLEQNDLLGIQVYKNGNAYCCGLFDDLTNAQVALLAGYTYTFEATMIKNVKNKLDYKNNAVPFQKNVSFRGLNRFEYSSNFYYTLFANGRSYLSDGRSGIPVGHKEYCNKIDRYYCWLSDYTPTVNGTIQLPLRRVSFGIKVEVTGITDGSVSIRCWHNKSSLYLFYNNPSITSNIESPTEIYSLYNIVDAWQYADDDYQEAVNLSVEWTRGNGIVQNLGTKTAYVKRNAVNVFKIKLSTNDTDVDVDVDPEEGDMGNEDEDLSN